MTHAKNVSIFLEPDRIRLAPFYDLMSTCVYPELVDKLSVKIGRENRFRWAGKRHWERFASEVGVKSDFVLREAARIAEKTLREAESTAHGIVSGYGGERIVSKIVETIRKNAASIRSAASKSPV